MAVSPYQPDDAPDRFESGTMNMFGIAGLHAAVRFLLETGVETVRAHEIELMEMLLSSLRDIGNVTLYGPQAASNRLGLVSFNIQDQDPYEIARKLDESHDIKVRAGLHCAPQAHRMVGTVNKGAVRVSLGYFNTKQDIDCFIEAVETLC
ncbi:MAG: aminotransferase class V-fold PLP-dependent enzyme [Coriobacteriales bacterium]|jgi:selenocysteine lyase/cysteine desulfurase|nr:aminotransferase class V-fold PLP-dependent enzyme [Coriobacteriales bacterium]